jgi:hypothetical protein
VGLPETKHFDELGPPGYDICTAPIVVGRLNRARTEAKCRKPLFQKQDDGPKRFQETIRLSGSRHSLSRFGEICPFLAKLKATADFFILVEHRSAEENMES